jgi:hypothetical protein
MKHSNTWFASILIASALLLSGVKNLSAEQKRDEKHQGETAEQREKSNAQQTILVPSPAYQAAILGALRSVVHEEVARQEQEHADYKRWNTPAFWFGTIGLLVVGAAYTFFAGWQLAVIRKQLSLQYRPDLIVRDVRLVGAPNAFRVGEPLEVSLSIANKGSGDATILNSYFVVKILPFGELPHHQVRTANEAPEFQDGDVHYFESQLRGGPVIGAGKQTLPISKRKRFDLSPEELRQLTIDATGTAAPSHAVWAIGMIFYQDSAGRYRKTGFCRKYMTSYARFITMDDPELEYTY